MILIPCEHNITHICGLDGFDGFNSKTKGSLYFAISQKVTISKIQCGALSPCYAH